MKDVRGSTQDTNKSWEFDTVSRVTPFSQSIGRISTEKAFGSNIH